MNIFAVSHYFNIMNLFFNQMRGNKMDLLTPSVGPEVTNSCFLQFIINTSLESFENKFWKDEDQ